MPAPKFNFQLMMPTPKFKRLVVKMPAPKFNRLLCMARQG